jgi:histidinol dehydrogenase
MSQREQGNIDVLEFRNRLDLLFEQAKEMEKEQIKKAYYAGDNDVKDNPDREAEQYYHETFKSETIVTEFKDGTIKVETFKSE